MSELQQKTWRMSDDWLQKYVGSEIYDYPFTWHGRIKWAETVATLNGTYPQTTEELFDFFINIANHSAKNGYGSYELQIILDALVRGDAAKELVGWRDKLNDKVEDSTMRRKLIDAIEDGARMVFEETKYGVTQKYLRYHNFMDEYKVNADEF